MTERDVGERDLKEKEQRPQDHVVVCGLTRYPGYQKESGNSKDVDQVRGQEALETLKLLTQEDYHVIIGDSESSPDFLKEVREIQGVEIQEADSSKDMSDQRVELFNSAKEKKMGYILILELDTKGDLVRFIPELFKVARDTEADVVVPMRDENCFKSLSKCQSKAEKTAVKSTRRRIERYTDLNSEDLPGDIWFGPKFIRTEEGCDCLHAFTDPWPEEVKKYDRRYPSLNLGVIRATRRGHTVIGHTVQGFTYPRRVVDIERDSGDWNKKRVKQFSEQIHALREYLQGLRK